MKKPFLFKLICLIAAAILSMAAFAACAKNSVPDDEPPPSSVTPETPEEPQQPPEEEEPEKLEAFKRPYNTQARYGYYFEDIGIVARNVPAATDDGGLTSGYPTYGSTLALTTEEKDAIVSENVSLCGRATQGSSGPYDKMDKDGNLFLSDGTPVNSGANKGKLYKHSASRGMFLGDVSDSEQAIVRRITYSPRRGGSYNVTGLYAPAGEVIKLEMSEADLAATGGITVHIGQALYNGQCNNIWSARNFNRMPMILNTMVFNAQNSVYNAETQTYTCYVGSFLGGPIYVRDPGKKFTVTISGAVKYRHFILGKTTEAEFTELCKSTVPYFDLEVWDNGVLLSGPLHYAKKFSYTDLYNAAVLWDKISGVSTRVKNQGIVFLFDPFVAAGAAVAFPGRSSVNCPMAWMEQALNYDAFITSGSWGNVHEYNHNFQGWGLPGGGEVTNNALSLASYAQFTKVSASRTMTSSGESGLSGWNAYTNASWALNRVLDRAYDSTNQLCIYAALLHNLGVENFALSARGSGTTAYYKSLCNVTGYDMTYFFRELIAQEQELDAAAVAEIEAKNLPAFVPVSSIYQTGRSIISGGAKKYVYTMQPYSIEAGKPFTVDLTRYTKDGNGFYQSGTIVLPDDFDYTVKNVTTPSSGSMSPVSKNVYTYTPAADELSGKIFVTLGITKKDRAFEVADVDLVLEFKQDHELTRSMLERTVYTYTPDTFYASARAAYEGGYAGYSSKIDKDNTNSVQNSNTDIWGPEPNQNAIMEVRGKLYVTTDGDYRLALRGRKSCAVYYSTDGTNYTLGGEINDSAVPSDSHLFRDDPATYTDLKGLKAGSFVYFKEVLRVDYSGAYIGLGWGRFELNGTMNENGEFVDSEGNVIQDPQPTVAVEYANGYRQSYKFTSSEFTADYLFDKSPAYTYVNNTVHPQKGSLVSSSGFTPWDGSTDLNNLFDADTSNKIHSAKNADITPQSPFDITVDLGESITATAMTLYGVTNQVNYIPKKFDLYVGSAPDKLNLVATQDNATRSSNNADLLVTFAVKKFRYYRLVCTETYLYDTNPVGAKYIAFRYIEFSYPFSLPSGTKTAPDAAEYYGEWQIKDAPSSFGRVYSGKENYYAELTFTGKRFAVFSPDAENCEIKVEIDGAEAAAAPAGLKPSKTGLAFLSGSLGDGTHTVKITLLKDCEIDSFVIW